MRLFIGLFPPKEVLDQLRDIRRQFFADKRNLQFIEVDQLHITLKFIGSSVSEASKNQLVEAFNNYSKQLGTFNVEFQNITFGFKKDTFPKYLLANIKKSKELKQLANAMHQIVKNQGLDDTIRFKYRSTPDFHITLARLKRSASRSVAIKLKANTQNTHFRPISSFEANEITLVESMYEKGSAPKYKKLERFLL